MKTLGDFTSPALMLTELQSDTATGAVAELCSLLQQEQRLSDSAAFYDAVMARESLNPTTIAPAWALPHARLKDLTQLSFALALSSRPLVWFKESSIRPQMIFLFAVPDSEAKTYLNLIAAVARLTQSPALLEQLRCARDSNTMFSVLEQVPLGQRGPVHPDKPHRAIVRSS